MDAALASNLDQRLGSQLRIATRGRFPRQPNEHLPKTQLAHLPLGARIQSSVAWPEAIDRF